MKTKSWEIMKTDATFLTKADCEREARELISFTEILYSGSEKLQKLRDACERYLADMRGLLENRGLNAPTIGFVGDKTAGKSYLMRMLIEDDSIKSFIPSGLGSEGRTERLIWVGKELPVLDRTAEIGLQLDNAEKQLRLGQEVTLVDVPSFNDAHSAAASRARDLALRSCQVKVLVFDVAVCSAERVADFVRLAPGPIIVPVLNRMRDASKTAKAKKFAADYECSIRNAITTNLQADDNGDAVVQPVLLIPDAKISPPVEDPIEVLARFRKAIQDAAAEVIRRPHLEQSAAHVRRNRFLDEVGCLFRADFDRVKELLVKIERDSQALPQQLLPHLLTGKYAAEVGIRIWLRAELVHRTPAIFIPLRTFLGLVALTSRSWDNLLLALSGIPSLFSSLFKISGIGRLLGPARDNGTEDELESAVRRLVVDRQFDDLVALRRHLDGMSGTSAPENVVIAKPRIEGLYELRSAASEAVEEIVRANAVSKWCIHLVGVLSLAWCGVMLYGPLRAVYGHYLSTLWYEIHNGAPLAWTDFPVPPLSTIVGWFVLAFLPVLAIALLLQAFAATGGRLKRCRADMERAVEESMEKLVKQGVLVITVRDSKLDACRALFKRLFDPTASN